MNYLRQSKFYNFMSHILTGATGAAVMSAFYQKDLENIIASLGIAFSAGYSAKIMNNFSISYRKLAELPDTPPHFTRGVKQKD